MPVVGPLLLPPPQEYGVPTQRSAAATAASPLAALQPPEPTDGEFCGVGSAGADCSGGAESPPSSLLSPLLSLESLLPEPLSPPLFELPLPARGSTSQAT